MHKTLQKLLIVTTALTFSCSTFSVSAMLKGEKNEINEINKTEMIDKYKDLYKQLETSKKKLNETKNYVKLKETEMLINEKYMKDIEETIATQKVNQDIEKNEDSDYKALSSAKDDLQESIEQFTTAVQNCDAILSELVCVPDEHYNEDMTTYAKEILNIINDLDAITGAKDGNWENKMFELENKLTDFVNLAYMSGKNCVVDERLHDMIEEFKRLLSEYKEEKENMKEKKAKLFEMVQNVKNSNIEKDVKACEQQLNEAIQKYIQTKRELDEGECKILGCDIEVGIAMYDLQGHKDLMNKSNIPIPDMDDEEIEKDEKADKEEEIKKDEK